MPGVIWEDVVATKHPLFSDRMQLRVIVSEFKNYPIASARLQRTEPYRAALMCVGFIVKPNATAVPRATALRRYESEPAACWT
jgi:hypothetical protein